ncbi:AmmeMemoRadiSam system protein B [Candidatus Falkowbacteria bacterium]|nr:AmmeMemoRadiSam system protein B [Candidatus Falkowbacteria bacterium]
MLVFAGIVPHPPILIPNIGQDNLNKIKKTAKALNLLEEELIKSAPDTIIIISPHGELFPDAFNINTAEEYVARFQEFGDFETEMRFKSDLEFINHFKEQVEVKIPTVLSRQDNLDHGCSVPLFYLAQKLKDVRIVPITYSLFNYEKHLQFGIELKEAIAAGEKRYAIIASGDLSHRLALNAPAGFSPRAKQFDKKIVQLLKQKKAESVLTIDPELIEIAGECGLRSILVLLGIVKNMNYEFEVLSYEAPFGVGYLVGQFVFA